MSVDVAVSSYQATTDNDVAVRVEKRGEHGGHPPGTPEAFPGTHETRTHLRCLNYGSLLFTAIISFQMAPFMIFTLKYLKH